MAHLPIISGSRGLQTLFKFVLALLGCFLIYEVLLIFQTLLMPLAFAGIVSSILLPLTHRLERARLSTTLAATLSMVMLLLVMASLLAYFWDQAASFSEDYDILSLRVHRALEEGVQYYLDKFEQQGTKPQEYLSQKMQSEVSTFFGLAASTLRTTTDLLVTLVLVVLYSLLILIYRRLLLRALISAFYRTQSRNVLHATERIRKVMSHYMVGLFIVMAIMCIILTTGLYIIGVEHAFFFGLVGSVLNLVPYLGIFGVGIITALYGGLMLNSWVYFLVIIGFFYLVHLVESNLITPNLVGGRVSLNALASIFAVVLGGEIWGFGGMMLALPYLAALKIVTELVPSLKPLSILIGDTHAKKHPAEALAEIPEEHEVEND